MKFQALQIFLRPLSWLYAAAVWVRNMLYDEHILRSHAVPVPTIVVGNLAVGGTGKTPFVEQLIRWLSPHYNVAVLSRGYGRKSHGFVLADAASDALTLGDEPYQIHHHFPQIPLAVCADRVYGVKRLKQLCPSVDVVILDDAFQHRRLYSGMNILLTSYDNLYIHDHYLPAGRLRDHIYQVRRANMVVVTHCPQQMKPIDKRIIDNALHLATWQNLYFSSVQYSPVPKVQDALLVTGVAHSHYLEQYLRTQVTHLQSMTFADHHWFTPKDMLAIEQQLPHVDAVFTTEKDEARLDSSLLSDELASKLHPVPITLSIDDEQGLLRSLHMYIHEQLRHK